MSDKKIRKKSVRSFVVNSVSGNKNISKSRIQKGSKLQAIVFLPTKKNKWTRAKTSKWIKDHNVKNIKPADVKIELTKITQIRYRLQDPSIFKSFITKKNKEFDINFIIGFM